MDQFKSSQVQLSDADLERLSGEKQTTVYKNSHETVREEWDMGVVSDKFRELHDAFERHVAAHPEGTDEDDKGFLDATFGADPVLKRCCADHPRFAAMLIDREVLSDRTRLDVLFAMLAAKASVQSGGMTEEQAQQTVVGAMVQRHHSQQSK